MPYKRNADLPDPVKSALPDAAQTIWRGAFNGSVDEQGEEAARKIAWAAVKNKYKKEGDKWVAKDSTNANLDDMEWTETYIIDKASDKFTPTSDGYLALMPRVARSGIQIYNGDEVRRPDLKEVRVYRPPEEVFHKDALKSAAHRPITNDHPSEHVTAKNWRQHSVGMSGDEVVRDGEAMRVSMLVMDAATIKDVNEGKRELSAGYKAELVWGDGVTPTGEKYDAQQKSIRVNHIAIVRKARGGPTLRLGDDGSPHETKQTRKERKMVDRSFLIDGISIELDDRDGQHIERHIKMLTDSLASEKKATEQHVVTIATMQKTIKDHEAKVATLEKQVADGALTPEKQDALIAKRQEMLEVADAIMGPALVIDGRPDSDIRKQVVLSELGDVAKGWNDSQIQTAFDTIAAKFMRDNQGQQQPHQRDNGYGSPRPGFQDLAREMGRPAPMNVDPRAEAFNESVRYKQDAWKDPADRAPAVQTKPGFVQQ